MQTALALRTAAPSVSRTRTLLFEVYSQDYYPDAGGVFHPEDAIALWSRASGSPKPISLTRSGSTATATSTAHGYLSGISVDISGAVQPEYNGTFVITVTDANHFTYTLAGTPTTPATGTITSVSQGLAWLGHLYVRQVLSHSPISRYMTSQFNNVSLTLSNVDLSMSAFVVGHDIEGMRLVIRYIDLNASAAIADSIVLFVGRLELPTSIDSEECQLDAEQELASLDIEVPKRRFSPTDANGRSPNDPLFEGFNLATQTGNFKYSTVVTKRVFFNLFSKNKVETATQQWSSETGSSQDQIVRLIFGRVQVDLVPIIWADVGFFITGIWVAAGHKVTSFSDVTVQSSNFLTDDRTQKFTKVYVDAHTHLGDPGGTGTNASAETVDGSLPNNSALLSRVAYLGLKPFGPESPVASSPNSGEDPVPTITAIVRGEADLPNGSGVFNQKGFTDSPAYLARFVLTSPDMFGLDPRLINDAECILAHNECYRILKDDTNGELLFLNLADSQALIDGLFTRYNSSGVLTPTYWKWAADGTAPNPYTTPRTDAFALPIDTGDPSHGCSVGQHWDPITGTCVVDAPLPKLVSTVTKFRRAYTFNAPLQDSVNASDFLFNTLFPAANLFMLVGPDGKLKIKKDKPADSSYLFASASVGATSIQVNDVEPWRASLLGYVLIGVNLVTSEYRPVTAATYSGGNSLTLAVSSPGTTISRSGATFSGGTSSVPATASVTVTARGSNGDVLVVTIDGIAISYTVASADNISSIAAVLAATINADWTLKTYIRAVWDPATPTVVNLYSKLGTLAFTDPLVNLHKVQLDSPTAAPTAAPTSGGTIPAGVYYLAYSYVDGNGGETLLSPRASVTLSGTQRISVSSLGSLPTGVANVNWYLSKAVNDDHLAFLTINAGGAFIIASLPLSDAQDSPVDNGTGEETIRIMAAFNERNILKGQFKWPQSGQSPAINQLTGKWIDAAAGFVERTLVVNDYAHQKKIRKVNKKEINLRGVDNFSQASRRLNQELSKEQEARTVCEWGTDEAGMVFEEGDVVACTDTSGGFINLPLQLEAVQIQEDLTVSFTGRLYSTNTHSDQAGRHPVILPTTLKYPPPDPTSFIGTFDLYNKDVLEEWGGKDFPFDPILEAYDLEQLDNSNNPFVPPRVVVVNPSRNTNLGERIPWVVIKAIGVHHIES